MPILAEGLEAGTFECDAAPTLPCPCKICIAYST
jgi:hypothetical protein